MSMSEFMQAAYAEAKASYDDGGIPVGAVLVHAGEIVSRGRNRQEQQGSNLLHAETDALERAGRRGRPFFRSCELYTTLSPCSMCSGTALFYEIPRVIIGDAVGYDGEIEWLRSRGVQVDVEQSDECAELLRRFIDEQPELWQKATE